MSMLYEVWDNETGNCIGAYPDQGAALADVRAAVRAHGPQAAASLVLLTAPDVGEGEHIAAGTALVQLAASSAPPIPPGTPRAAIRSTGSSRAPGKRGSVQQSPATRRYKHGERGGVWYSRSTSVGRGHKRGPKKG